MGIRISGIGGYVPAKTLTNHELAMAVDTSHEWIIAKTGIRRAADRGAGGGAQRHGPQAALRCLANAGVDKIGGRPDHRRLRDAGSVAAGGRLHGAGEAGHRARGSVPAFDVNSVCAGFVFALNVAQGMMLTEPARYRNVLVIGTDAFSKIMNWKDRRTCVFFGDGAGAVLLSQTETATAGGFTFTWAATGAGANSSQVPGGGTRLPASPGGASRSSSTTS